MASLPLVSTIIGRHYHGIIATRRYMPIIGLVPVSTIIGRHCQVASPVIGDASLAVMWRGAWHRDIADLDLDFDFVFGITPSAIIRSRLSQIIIMESNFR